MDIVVSILAMITGIDDVPTHNSLPECNFTTIVNECVFKTEDGMLPAMINADDNVVLIYAV